ncbi:hypothetical protein Hanom_Chr10g00874271 [Helianthus anomalus]
MCCYCFPRYQSTFLCFYQTMELIETFIHVCIIYDLSKSNKGALALKALLFSAKLNRDLEDTST